jgi:hypothetical protein
MSLSTQGSDDGENSRKRRRKGLGMLDDDDDGTPLALGGPIKVSAASEASGGASLVRRALGPCRSCDEMCQSIMGLCDRCEQKFEASRKDEDDEDDEPADQGGAAGAAAEAPLNRGNRLEIVDPDGPARELSVFEVEALKNMRSRRETKLREESAKLDVMLREQKHNDVTIEPLSALRDLVRQQAGPVDICLARQVLELARAAAQKHEDEIRARLSQIPLDRKQIQFDENLQRFLWEHCGWTSPSCQSDLSNDLNVSNVFRASAASSCGGRSLFYAVLF